MMEQHMAYNTTTSVLKNGKLVEGDLSRVDEDEEIELDMGYDSGEDEDDTSVQGHKSSRKAQEEEERKSLLNRKEQKGVQCLRIVVYTVLIVTAVLVSIGVYLYAQQQEEHNFQQVFEINANKLSQAFLDSVDRKIVAVGGLSTSITNYALTHNLTFPNVTIDGWESLSVQTRIQADGMVVEWCPLVTDETRAGWEEYAYTHKDWRATAYAKEQIYKEQQDAYFGLETKVVGLTGRPEELQAELSSKEAPSSPPDPDRALQEEPEPPGEVHVHVPLSETDGKTPNNSTTQGGGGDGGGGPPPYKREIFIPVFSPEGGRPAHVERPPGSGPYAPRWQMSPIMPHEFLMNIDLMGLPTSRDSYQAVMKRYKAVLGQTEAVVDPNNITVADMKLIGINRDFLQRGQFRHEQDFYKGDPTTFLTYPVFDTFGTRNRTLAGFLQMPLIWRLNLEKVLPEGLNGITAVIKNNMNQSFTYSIDGPKVTYLGLQDFHDTRYDDMYVFQNMADTIKANHGPDSQAFDAVELDTEYGSYYIYVYPSQTLEEEYITNEPAIYAITVASIFLFTLLVLMAFDFLVARRQHVILKKAVESTALVSTLYPKQVRERLFEDDHTEVSAKQRRSRWQAPRSSMTGASGSTIGTSTTMVTTTSESKAIAERYSASSVLLMDLAGFTRWASSREPEAVFILLEHLYQSFDRIAAKRKVYKIETIGDCWVGVTGVPDPQDDHAPRMAKFAAACQVKMGQLIANVLTDKLGADTADLALRVGIDSGPITGGILRGDRGRFQLFGDTINTASRMESNGVPGKIHVSQAFADEMIRHDYEHWLVERADKIHAKGKGLMTTYFVNVVNIRSTTTRSTTEAYTESDDDISTMWNSSQRDSSNWNHSSRLDCSGQSGRFPATDESIQQGLPQPDTQVEV